jgi:hypothetical protein
VLRVKTSTQKQHKRRTSATVDGKTLGSRVRTPSYISEGFRFLSVVQGLNVGSWKRSWPYVNLNVSFDQRSTLLYTICQHSYMASETPLLACMNGLQYSKRLLFGISLHASTFAYT